MGVPLGSEGKPIPTHVPFSASWPAPQGTVRSLSAGVPTSSSSTAGQFFLPTGAVTTALSTADVGRWADRLSRVRYDPLLHSLWQSEWRASVPHEAISLSASLCTS